MFYSEKYFHYFSCTTQVQTYGQYSYLHNCVASYAKQIQRDMFGNGIPGPSHEYVNEPNTQDVADDYVMTQPKKGTLTVRRKN